MKINELVKLPEETFMKLFRETMESMDNSSILQQNKEYEIYDDYTENELKIIHAKNLYDLCVKEKIKPIKYDEIMRCVDEYFVNLQKDNMYEEFQEVICYDIELNPAHTNMEKIINIYLCDLKRTEIYSWEEGKKNSPRSRENIF